MKNQRKNVLVFRQGYEELYQLGYQTAALMVTDLLMFTKFGVGQKEVDELKQLVNAFGNRDFDEEYLLDQKLTTQEKNDLLDSILVILYELEIKLNLIFPDNDLLINIFALSAVRQMSETEVSEKARATANLLDGKFSSLFAPHIEEQQIATLREKAHALSALLDNQSKVEKERHIATQIRAAQANELFEYIRRIRRAGRKMWALTDFVRSNAYLMPTLSASSQTTKTGNDDFVDETDTNLNENDS